MSDETADDDNLTGQRLLLACVVLVYIAAGLWSGRAWISSWFASAYIGTINLLTIDESDDARLQRAFAAVRGAAPVEAVIELGASDAHVRHGFVHLSAPTSDEAVAAAKTLSDAIVAAFDAEAGRGKLEASPRRRADPAPGAAGGAALTLLTYGAPLFGLAAIALLWRGRRDIGKGLPPSVVWPAAFILFFPVAMILLPGWAFVALFAQGFFTAIAGVIVYRARRAQRAARWPATQGRIERSKLKTKQLASTFKARSVGNLADIDYSYSVGGVDYRSNAIGVGDIGADSSAINTALDRYTVGRSVLVYFNPANPNEALLERDTPLRPSTLYLGAGFTFLLGLAIIFAFTNIGNILDWLEPYFPPDAQLPFMLFFAAAGLVSALSIAGDRRSASAAADWPRAMGKIVESVAESHREISAAGRTMMTVWSPKIEYQYSVAGRDYHSSHVAYGAVVSGGKTMADRIVARYPQGQTVMVHYDPANPALAVLETEVAHARGTMLIAAAFFAGAVYFSGIGQYLHW
jgi:uncharacterized protein DUF3592